MFRPHPTAGTYAAALNCYWSIEASATIAAETIACAVQRPWHLARSSLATGFLVKFGFECYRMGRGDERMSVTFELPSDIEQGLRRAIGDLGQAAKEATLIELYRQQQINQNELARALGVSRLECESLLKKHLVTEDLMTEAEYDKALARLSAISGT